MKTRTIRTPADFTDDAAVTHADRFQNGRMTRFAQVMAILAGACMLLNAVGCGESAEQKARRAEQEERLRKGQEAMKQGQAAMNQKRLKREAHRFAMRERIGVELVGFGDRPGLGEVITFRFTNHAEKAIRSFKGLLLPRAPGRKDLPKFELELNALIPPGGAIKTTDAWLMANETRQRIQREGKSLTFELQPTHIVYEDGSIEAP
jgi:hypothetical protein